MNIREYLSLNRNKIVSAFDKEDIKDLLNFKEIAKNLNMEGIIVSGKYIGFSCKINLESRCTAVEYGMVKFDG